MFQRAVPSVLALVALSLTGACDSTPVHPHDAACSLDTDAVSKLLGSDRFTAEDEELTEVPLTQGSASASRTSCLVDRGDNRIVVEALIVDSGTADDEEAMSKESSTSFEYRGGLGRSTVKGVSWTCGNVRVRIFLLEEPKKQPDWQELAEPVWDRAGCLTYASPGKASQPEGWEF